MSDDPHPTTTVTGIPDDLLPLLYEPNIGFLGTIRPDGAVQVNPMWFAFDGTHLRFTHTTKRRKYRNLQLNPAMTLAVSRPSDPERYLELRGRLIEATPDPDGSFFVHLQGVYGWENPTRPADAADRVILVMAIEHVSPR